MHFLRYYGRVVRVAATHSIDLAQWFLFVIIILTGTLTDFLPAHSMIAHLLARESAVEPWKIAVSVLGLIVAVRIVLAQYWIHQEQENKLAASQQGLPQLKLTKVVFEKHLDTEMYVDFEIANPGEPTVIKDWTLTVRTTDNSFSFQPRIVATSKVIHGRYGDVRSDNMTETPFEKGGYRTGRLTFTVTCLVPKERLGAPGTIFVATARDVLGRPIVADYTLSTAVLI